MNFTDKKRPGAGKTFEQKLDDVVGRIQIAGTQGVRFEGSKGSYSPTRFFDSDMTPDVKALGAAMQNMTGITPEVWAMWMCDAQVVDEYGKVVVYHRSPFFAKFAGDRVGWQMRKHLKKTVEFRESLEIAQRVNARTA